jgi:hypothetical protein
MNAYSLTVKINIHADDMDKAISEFHWWYERRSFSMKNSIIDYRLVRCDLIEHKKRRNRNVQN